MKPLICLLATLLSATVVHGEATTLEQYPRWSPIESPPYRLVVDISAWDGSRNIRVPGPMITNFNTGPVWTIDPTTAASWGINWAELDAIFRSPPPTKFVGAPKGEGWTLFYGNPQYYNGVESGTRLIGGLGGGPFSQLHKIEFTIDEYRRNTSPVLVRATVRVTGEGYVAFVPEPATWVLVVFAVGLFNFTRKRGGFNG